jgi:hypothetical protein
VQTWIESQQLASAAERPSQADRAAAREAKRRARHMLRFVPMTDRLAKLLDDLPIAERDQPRPIAFFRQALQAKYPARGAGRASVAEIGPALRQLGWQRHRQWKDPTAGFLTLWFPPGNDQ